MMRGGANGGERQVPEPQLSSESHWPSIRHVSNFRLGTHVYWPEESKSGTNVEWNLKPAAIGKTRDRREIRRPGIIEERELPHHRLAECGRDLAWDLWDLERFEANPSRAETAPSAYRTGGLWAPSDPLREAAMAGQ